MKEFVNNPIVQQVFFYIMGVVTPIIIQVVFRSRPKPQWDVISNSPILSGNEHNNIFKVLYNEKTLSNLRIMNAMFINNGQLGLRKGDIAKPVSFIFDSGVEVIDIINVTKSNDTIDVSCSTHNGQYYVTITFDYLNSKEGVVFSILQTCSNEKGYIVQAEFIDNMLTSIDSSTKVFNIITYIVSALILVASIAIALMIKIQALLSVLFLLLPISVAVIIIRIEMNKKLPNLIKGQHRNKNK